MMCDVLGEQLIFGKIYIYVCVGDKWRVII